MKSIYTALAAFQQEVPAIKKNASGYGYKFADFDEITKAIKPILSKYKLGFTQPIDGMRVRTIVFHTESGESIEGSAEIPQGVTLKGQNEFQTMGSAITYLRRYGLISILGLVTDEDADAAGETGSRQVQTPASRNVVAENAKYMNLKGADLAAPSESQLNEIARLAKKKGTSTELITRGLLLIETSRQAEDKIAELKKEVGE